MRALPRGPIVTLDDRGIEFRDVVLAGMSDGSWNELVHWTAEGLRRSESGVGDVRSVAERFRRDRKLESGQDLRAWLADRDLTLEQWKSHLGRRSSLSAVEPISIGGPELPPGIDEEIRVDALCRGYWSTEAGAVISWMAAAELVDPSPPPRTGVDRLVEQALADPTGVFRGSDEGWCRNQATTLMGWRDAHDRLVKSISEDRAIDKVIADRRLEWTTLDIDSCALNSESAAREAVMCCTEDGLGSEAIADRAGSAIRQRSERFELLRPEVGVHLMAAPLDTPVGPILEQDKWSVFWVRDRRTPESGDPEVRAAVTMELVRGRIDRHVAGRVHWCVPL